MRDRARGCSELRASRLSILLAVGLALALGGCSDEDCVRALAAAPNGEGSRTALLEVTGCGGATVGYVSDLKLTRSPKSAFGGHGYVWTAKGSINAELKWLTARRLEVRYPATLDDSDIVRKDTRWFDVEIVYRPTAGND